MDVLPLSLKIEGQPCLVVGGGETARRKIELLVAAGGAVTVVALRVSEAVQTLCRRHGLAIEARAFAADDVRDQLLVIAATNDSAVNEAVAAACASHRVLVNCVDDGNRSTALFPAIVDRGAVTVAIGTGGASPTLARQLRTRIEAVLPASIGALAAYLGSRRERIKAALPALRARQRFWDHAIDSELAALVARGDEYRADQALEAALNAPLATGFVSLVGAGPGDPDLLTLKALQRLQQADVVYHDSLASPAVLDRCRRDARRVDVGRRGMTGAGAAAERQAAINQGLLADARRGLRVVRLKGGDPLLFGRGGEEVAALAEHGVPFEIVPGITAALGCAAVAGIPLTHREWAKSVRFLTARVKDGAINADWPELAKPDQTLVVYMGLAAVDALCERLLAAGAAPTTPAAMVFRATLVGERTIVGDLRNLAAKVRAARLDGPATAIVGRVAALAKGDD